MGDSLLNATHRLNVLTDASGEDSLHPLPNGLDMRRRALLGAASGLAVTAVAGCVATTNADYEFTVRSWQDRENRQVEVDVAPGDTIRIEIDFTQSHGVTTEIWHPSIEDGQRVADIGPYTDDREPTDTIEYEVEHEGQHVVVITPCCRSGPGWSFASVSIFLD